MSENDKFYINMATFGIYKGSGNKHIQEGICEQSMAMDNLEQWFNLHLWSHSIEIINSNPYSCVIHLSHYTVVQCIITVTLTSNHITISTLF